MKSISKMEEYTLQVPVNLMEWCAHMGHTRGIAPVEGIENMVALVCWECGEILLVGDPRSVRMNLWDEPVDHLTDVIIRADDAAKHLQDELMEIRKKEHTQ